VSISALPARIPASGMVFPRQFAITTTDAYGRYSLHGVPDGLAKFRDGNGEIVLELSSVVDGLFHGGVKPTDDKQRAVDRGVALR